MNADVTKAVNQAVQRARRAVTAEKQAAIAAIENDQPADTTALNATTRLLRTLESALAAYQGAQRTSPKRKTAPETKTTRVRRGGATHTPSKAFVRPILETLHDMGGEAVGNDVLDEVARRLPLKEDDFQRSKTRGRIPRWRNAAMWVRYDLSQRGYISLDPDRKGRWVLTPSGEHYLETLTVDDNSSEA